MKKVLCIASIALLAVTAVQAEEGSTTDEPGNIGVGYQGILLGNLLSGVAVRGTPAPIGWQAEIVQGMIDVDGNKVDLMIVKGKAYYALVERTNSKFYTGASLGYWNLGLEDFLGADIDGWSVAPLIGAEWNFSEIPELGFNFEVSYEFNQLEVDDVDVDIDIYGVNVSTGVTYYF